MVMRKEGRKPKDAMIVDGFNMEKKGGLSKKGIREARMEKARLEREEKARRAHVDKLESDLAGLRKALGDAEAGIVPDIPDMSDYDLDAEMEDHDKNAFQMLKDMREIYRKVGGKAKLQRLMKEDKAFMYMVKELIKIETSLLAAKIKAKSEGFGGGQQTVFVVMKGLHDDPTQVDTMITVGNRQIDMGQIRNALNPASIKQEQRQEEAPKKIEGPETW